MAHGAKAEECCLMKQVCNGLCINVMPSFKAWTDAKKYWVGS